MKKNKTVEYGKYGLMFLIPFFLVFLIFQLYPLIYTFYNSFIYSAKNGRYVTTSVGLGNFTNYVFAKTGSEFWQALAITVVLWLVNFVPQILLALVLAAWFTDIKVKIKGQGTLFCAQGFYRDKDNSHLYLEEWRAGDKVACCMLGNTLVVLGRLADPGEQMKVR